MGAGLRIGRVSTGMGFRLFGPHGSVTLTEVGEGVVFLDLEGIAYAAFCERLLSALEVSMEKAGGLTLFVDASRLRTYETEFRRLWTRWLQLHRDGFRAGVVLACTPMVRMWIDVVNVVTGGLLFAATTRGELYDLLCDTLLEGQPRALCPPGISGRPPLELRAADGLSR
jgi:hypothetical protein